MKRVERSLIAISLNHLIRLARLARLARPMTIIKTILGMFLLFNRLSIIDIYNRISFLKNIVTVIECDKMESKLKKCLVENDLVKIKEL